MQIIKLYPIKNIFIFIKQIISVPLKWDELNN